MELKGTQTEKNLRDAFSGESQANRKYLYFAARADIEGHTEAAEVFRAAANGETGHAHGHLAFLEEANTSTEENLLSAIAGETYEFTDMYVVMAETARAEGFEQEARWFDLVGRAEKSHARRFQEVLDNMRNQASPGGGVS